MRYDYMAENLHELSMDELLEKLRKMIEELVSGVDRVLDENKELGLEAVGELRDHISSRFNESNGIQDREKLLKLLGLFIEDTAALEIIREDAEEWVKLLNAIEESMVRGSVQLSEKEIEEIGKLTSDIRNLIRKPKE